MALARQTIRRNPMRDFLGMDAEPGEVPSSIAINDYLAGMDPTVEQQREGSVLAAADGRAERSIHRDLAEAENTRGLRRRGFQSSFPQQEAEQYDAEQKLRMMLIPKQMELEAAHLNREEGREFTAGQNQMNRDAMAARATGVQEGQNQRQSARDAEVRARNVERTKQAPGTAFWRKLLGVLPGVDSNEDLVSREASRIRSEGLASAGQGQTIRMQAPNGRFMQVPFDRVEELETQGAIRVN